MLAFSTMLSFGLAFFVFAASPGPDNITILSKTVSHGPAHGLAYGAGVVCSILGFVILASTGFSALAGTLIDHFRFVQYVGAAYLVYTGIQTWRSRPATPRHTRGGLAGLFFTGLLLNITNPKMPIFYLALLPSVLGLTSTSVSDTLFLLVLVAGIEVVVVGGYVWAGLKAKRSLSDPRRLQRLNRGAGALMVGAGVLVASR